MTQDQFRHEWKRHLSRLRIYGRGFVPTNEEQIEYSTQVWKIMADKTPAELEEYFKNVEAFSLMPTGPDIN